MARDILTNDEISEFMDENYAYKPRLEDFMLDLMEGAPMLLGFPLEISRPTAHKQLRKAFMQLGREKVGKARELVEEMLELRTENPQSAMADAISKELSQLVWSNKKGKTPRVWSMKEMSDWKDIMKGTKHLPQEILDPLKKMNISNDPFYGGTVSPSEEFLEMTTTGKNVYEALAHEGTHVLDLKGHFGLPLEDFNSDAAMEYLMHGSTHKFDVPPTQEYLDKLTDMHAHLRRKGFYEAKAYETGLALGDKLQEGPVSYEDWLQTMAESEGKVLEKFGDNPTETNVLKHYFPEDPFLQDEDDTSPLQVLESLVNKLLDLGMFDEE